MDKGLHILLTCAQGEYGRVLADKLAEEGHTVLTTLRDIQGLNDQNYKEWEETIDINNLPIHFFEMDILDDLSVRESVKKIVDEFEHIDVVINDFGIFGLGFNESFSSQNLKAIFEANVFVPFRVNNAVLPYMRKNNSGLLIHISNDLGRLSFPFSGIFNASKAALEAMAESYRYDLSLLGIDSVILETGSYPIEILNSVIQPENKKISPEYGPVFTKFNKLTGDFPAKFEGKTRLEPLTLAQAIIKIIRIPNGERPLRTELDKTEKSIIEINATQDKLQQNLLATMGLRELMFYALTKNYKSYRN